MSTTLILKAESPSCIWGRASCGPDDDGETSRQYSILTTQMNLFYHDFTRDQSKLKPAKLEQGEVYAVYCADKSSWCRAQVETVSMDSESYRAHCFLVDHGERVFVYSDNIRVIQKNFLQLPFWVRKFHLARIKPTTLRVPLCEEPAKLIPSIKWDSSACLYLHNLLQVSTQMEAVEHESGPESTSIMLYVTVGSIKICVNDDLVAKKFAHYHSQSVDGKWLDEAEQTPIMLSHSVLMQTAGKTVKKKKIDKINWPPDLTVVGAADLLTRSISSQSSNPELEGSEEGQTSPDRQSEKSLASSSSRSDCVEKTDSFLAASLSKHSALQRLPKSQSYHSSYQQGALSVIPNDEHCQPEEMTSAFSTRKQLEGAEAANRQVEMTPRNEEELLCSRLLEWLNPKALHWEDNAEEEEAAAAASPEGEKVSPSGLLVHSALPVEPCSYLADAPLLDTLLTVCRRKGYDGPSPSDRSSWPSIARGCNTVVVSRDAERPLSFLLPLLTHLLLSSVHAPHTSKTGPLAVLLCPGWERVQLVYELLEEIKAAATLHPATVLLGVGKDEAKNFKIPKNCLLLVTTPFALARLLSCCCFLFVRLYHLVLDEADRLFTLAPEQMATILQHFQKVISSPGRSRCPQQLVAVAKRWNSHMDQLVAVHMPYPCIVVAVPEESALYGNVQQVVLMALESSKVSVLLGTLDLKPDVGQKTVIITGSAQEVEHVFQAVRSKSAFCLMAHEGSTHEFDHVMQQWRRDVGPGTHVFLVTSSECLKSLGIRDATCVVHYSFPASLRVFGRRLLCMADNFRDLSRRASPQAEADGAPPPCRSLLLISEKNARHGVEILRFLTRAHVWLPPELLSFVQGVLVAREEQKLYQPFCGYLKSFGVCRDDAVCPNRHVFLPHLDQSELPASGPVEVLPLHVKTASVFCGRIVRQDDAAFREMVAEMTAFYSDNKPVAKELVEGRLYAVLLEEEVHRVKVLSVSDREEKLFRTVRVRFIDVGNEREVKSYQLLVLPEQFHSLPGQAVEIVVCRVKPADGETEWHPKVTRAIRQKMCCEPHQAEVAFSLGKTLFVHSMVRRSQVPGTKTAINEYNVQSLILHTGLATVNPEHLDLLMVLCQKAGHVSRSDDECASALELRIRAEEEVLTGALRAAEVSLPGEPPGPRSSVVLVPAMPQLELKAAVNPPGPPGCGEGPPTSLQPPGLESLEQNTRDDDGEVAACCSPADVSPCVEDGSNHQDAADIHTATTQGFHPQIRWYQTRDAVIVTVKLMNPTCQSCEFHPDRVVYSGRVGDRTYRAELDLQGSVATELCRCEVKSNEPVLTLVKQEPGRWERLVRIKNIFVSYDMDRFEDDEDGTLDGRKFEGNIGEGHWYEDSEGDSESD
ncbi:putative ATP-dependent RNA helicase TDRD12 isoform X2 [Nelusetta ayraudi]|uniref:putative ATP-dependent RNA helicase TDRD12 isoform X2 n=1 Tax=Nelusetta ayraudi TaxID=303726 RepID=UPI003F6F60D4